MSHDLGDELELDAERAWRHLREQDRNNGIHQLEALCVKCGMEWGNRDQRKALVIWRLHKLQNAANAVHKRNQAKGNVGFSI